MSTIALSEARVKALRDRPTAYDTAQRRPESELRRHHHALATDAGERARSTKAGV